MDKLQRGALYDAESVRAMDASAIAAGTPGYTLMRRAARSAFATIQRRWPRAHRIAVLCGPGNNGGDGYVIAELAHKSGRQVTLLQLSGPSGASAIQAHSDAIAAGLEARAFESSALDGAQLLVDAIFGTGLSRAPEGDAAQAIEDINAHPSPCFAIDIPSGLVADNGSCPGVAVTAEATISFIAPKLGLYTGEGPRCCGKRTHDTLGVGEQHRSPQHPVAYRLDAGLVLDMLPHRDASAHKGTAGHVLVIGGNHGMSGAVRLAAEAALRSGAGLLSVACHPDCVLAVSSGRPELMVHAIYTAADLEPLLERASVLVLGPGLGQDAWARALYKAAMKRCIPKVLDADALNLLADAPQACPRAVITPHPTEAARLLDTDTATVQSNRPHAAEQLSYCYKATAVLKGPGSLIATECGRMFLCDKGNAGMASGGMGDLLTGVIAALLAEGCETHQAAAAGTWLHSAAADLAAKQGQAGMIASDLLPHLRQLRDRPSDQCVY
ncbi:MAG: NAD(P)H-hydrate dehydratase [Granulosicoccaceae bacterium]